MAKDYEQTHRLHVSRLTRYVERLFMDAAVELAELSGLIHDVKDDKPFRFQDYPLTRDLVTKIIDGLNRNVCAAIVNGIDVEWALSGEKNDELIRTVFARSHRKVKAMSPATRARYYKSTDRALKAFKARKVAGLNLTDRVWNYTRQFRREIEWGLDLGIKEGKDAHTIAKELQQYLKYPDKLFRRVRNKYGHLVLSRAAKAFHPGQGVYRSSYKNARRLAATEVNMAYRTADHERWKNLDFVVGIRVSLSNNHTLNDEPFVDMCDELAGDYPKDFKFVGWHPQCRCHATSILKTPEELIRDLDGVDRGSVNAVTQLPPGFVSYIRTNRARIAAADERGTTPYFIRDNREAVDGILNRKAED